MEQTTIRSLMVSV